jgi:hypothetical protein
MLASQRLRAALLPPPVRYARLQCAAQYGLPAALCAPQKKKSGPAGSWTGHRQLSLSSSSNDRRCARGIRASRLGRST